MQSTERLYLGGVCFITGPHPELSIQQTVELALEGGIRWVQLRHKGLCRRRLYRLGLSLRELTERYGATLVVNDYPDLALAIGAHGVHLGQEDFPLREARALMGGRLIGLSTHSVEEALKAQGADYIGVGPIYHTATKEAGPPRGPGLIREVKAKVGMPVVAIGGIGPENLKDALEAGADAVALSGALLGAEDFLQAVRQLMDTLRQVLEELK